MALAAAGVVAAAGVAKAQSTSPAAAQRPSSPPAYSPYQAEKEVEVGKFYLKKGKYDAAIIRFQNARKYKPDWALPHLYLGEAYDKQGDPKRAVVEYREYLKITPYAKDAGKISKRIDKLAEGIKRATERTGGA
ncbi:MAG TPA: tetratricopeptide repeat protein [Candidatus Acidoferrales bacterium]|nr:tetratricopeptide repeat protein [Candidatus Acidoferrales bacterium]